MKEKVFRFRAVEQTEEVRPFVVRMRIDFATAVGGRLLGCTAE